MTPMTPSVVTSVLLIGFACCGAAGCGAATGRPDAEVARLVDEEDRRHAAARDRHLIELAAADLSPLELAAAGAAIETLALLYVPDQAAPAPVPPRAAPAVAAEESNPNWVEGPPPSWLDQPWPHSQAMDPDGAGAVSAAGRGSGKGGDYGPLAVDGGDGKSGKPKLRMDLLNLNFRGRPVSVSTSLKGLKGVQFKATIKM